MGYIRYPIKGGGGGQSFPPSSDLSMGGYKLTNLGTPTVSSDAATLGYVSSAISALNLATTYLKLDGTNSPNANISMDSHKITGLTDPTDSQDAATLNSVNSAISALNLSTTYLALNGSNSPSANVSWNNQELTEVNTLGMMNGTLLTDNYVTGLTVTGASAFGDVGITLYSGASLFFGMLGYVAKIECPGDLDLRGNGNTCHLYNSENSPANFVFNSDDGTNQYWDPRGNVYPGPTGYVSLGQPANIWSSVCTSQINVVGTLAVQAFSPGSGATITDGDYTVFQDAAGASFAIGFTTSSLVAPTSTPWTSVPSANRFWVTISSGDSVAQVLGEILTTIARADNAALQSGYPTRVSVAPTTSMYCDIGPIGRGSIQPWPLTAFYIFQIMFGGPVAAPAVYEYDGTPGGSLSGTWSMIRAGVGGSITLAPSTLPSSPVAGQIAFDGTNFWGYNGSAWKQLDN